MNNPKDALNWLHQLSSCGYRLTGPRRAIVEIVVNCTHAISPIEIYDIGRKEYPGLGLVTVYRTLDKLEELGLIQRVHQVNGCHMILPAAKGHEHILLCTHCGRAVMFSGDDLNHLFQAITINSGFQINDHWLQLFGICADCQVELHGKGDLNV